MDILLARDALPEGDGDGCECAVSCGLCKFIVNIINRAFHFSGTQSGGMNRPLSNALRTRSAPSPNTLAAYQLAATKSGNSTSPPHIAGGVFVSRNTTSATYPNSTASSTASSSTAYSSGTGSGSGNGSGSTTSGNAQSSPIVGFTGAASRMGSGLGAVCGGAGLVVFALLCI